MYTNDLRQPKVRRGAVLGFLTGTVQVVATYVADNLLRSDIGSLITPADFVAARFEPAPKLQIATAQTLTHLGWLFVLGSRLELLTLRSSGECSTN